MRQQVSFSNSTDDSGIRNSGGGEQPAKFRIPTPPEGGEFGIGSAECLESPIPNSNSSGGIGGRGEGGSKEDQGHAERQRQVGAEIDRQIAANRARRARRGAR